MATNHLNNLTDTISITWVIDSGANDHMCNKRKLFTNFDAINKGQYVTLRNGDTKIPIKGIENVLYVPDLEAPLFSIKCHMSIQGCSQHVDEEYILAFYTFTITADVLNEITFNLVSPSTNEKADFNEASNTKIPQPYTGTNLYTNNHKHKYIVQVKSTLARKKHKFLPTCTTPQSAGFDIHAIANTSIPPNSQKAIPTGLSMAIPQGIYGRIAPRSSLATKHHIDVGAG
eukprot:10859564-Ditylum_brightwellii.AAC.1